MDMCAEIRKSFEDAAAPPGGAPAGDSRRAAEAEPREIPAEPENREAPEIPAEPATACPGETTPGELAEQLRLARAELQQLQANQTAAEEAAVAERTRAVLDYAVSAAAAESGALDTQLVELLLSREELGLEDGRVTGLPEAMERIRQQRPYLFSDGGGRPRFAASVRGRNPSHEEERVARRYQNNPWYHRG